MQRFEADMKISGNESPIRVRLEGTYKEFYYKDGDSGSGWIPLSHLTGENLNADAMCQTLQGMKGTNVSVKGIYYSDGQHFFGCVEGELESVKLIEITYLADAMYNACVKSPELFEELKKKFAADIKAAKDESAAAADDE